MRQGKKKKDMQIERKKQNYSYSQMILYVQNFKQPTKELLELLNVLSTVVMYKINTQNSIIFLYTSKVEIAKYFLKMHNLQ